jgi:hypothetical protein
MMKERKKPKKAFDLSSLLIGSSSSVPSTTFRKIRTSSPQLDSSPSSSSFSTDIISTEFAATLKELQNDNMELKGNYQVNQNMNANSQQQLQQQRVAVRGRRPDARSEKLRAALQAESTK